MYDFIFDRLLVGQVDRESDKVKVEEIKFFENLKHKVDIHNNDSNNNREDKSKVRKVKGAKYQKYR